ncbi:methyltransferase domain-containing protein [Rubritalea tangerina]|uniref:Methyltransferase domain-containing protein n=1 Tax=Rubritalea tangerina TaxID=430798 RepID=A0ABW4ZF30_9BACT
MDWHERYQVGDTPWDKGIAAPALVDFISEHADFFSSGKKFLVPGCGRGYDAKVIARAGGQVLAADIVEEALEFGRRDNPDGIDFRCLDIFKISERWDVSFDGVWEHTCFCAIEPEVREAYVEVMWRILKPGGTLLGVFFTNPDMPEGEGPPYKTGVDVIERYFGELFEIEWIREPSSYYPGREGREHLVLMRKRGFHR